MSVNQYNIAMNSWSDQIHTVTNLVIHSSSRWLLSCDRAQWFLTAGAVWIIPKSFLNTAGTELVATFSLCRVLECLKTNWTH